ncbi:MAG TPA: tetratricopeptide repeat protein, partial [Rubrivivax sp.]|nr:tetratricopeptide repeat protein [Rubrivivax sp.]
AQVPPTLTGVLQARVDSLPPREKLTLQQASVIGVAFWDQALAAIDAQAPMALPSLVQRGLLVPHENTTLEGQREFAIKNQVLQQVIYDGLLRRDRRAWHACIAGWLGRIEGSRAREALGLAAQHYERAGDLAQAGRYYTRAAEDAAARYANSAMLSFVERALALTDPADHQTRWRAHLVRERHLVDTTDQSAHESDLQTLADLAERLDDRDKRIVVALRRAATLRGGGDYAGAEAAGRQGLALAQPLERSALAVELCGGLADSLIGAGKYEAAREIAEQGLQLAQERGDRLGESVLVNALGLIAMEQGELTVAAAHFEASLVISREVGDPHAEGLRLNNLGSVYPRLGDYARARSHLERGLQLARRIGHRSTEAALLLNTASVAHLQGDDTAALALANAALDAAAGSGQRDLEAFARLVAGHAELGLGRHAAARAAYTESRDMLRALTLRSQQVYDPISGLARVALAEGRLGLALEQVELMMAHMAAGGNFDGTEEPLLLPLTCWQVLHAAGDPRTAEVLAAAHAELQAQAARITDPQARRCFLQQVPHHREIVAAWVRSTQPQAAATLAAR